MKLLFLGDIFGRPGRRIVRELLPSLRSEFGIDFVIANGENAKHGKGPSLATYEELITSGIDYLTTGDHIWDDTELMTQLNRSELKILRPANYEEAVGRGRAVVEVGGQKLTIINLLGQVFVRGTTANPFRTFDELVQQAEGFVFVDFHAEATSEKVSFGHYVDGRAGAVVGTHTHVQTADERLLPKGTAYISDVGMCGPLNGSIGADLSQVLPSFLHGYPFKLEPASGPMQLRGVVIEIANDKAVSIERIQRELE
jgi:metallophosphoesterase (TIGR00282 family)